MSQVKRFRADHRHVVETEYDDAQFVSVADYDALQHRLTVAERRLGYAYEWGYGDGQNSPNGYSEKEDRDKCIAELLKPAETLYEYSGEDDFGHRERIVGALKSAEKPKYICDGCGSNGWTGSCDKCIPY